MRLYGFCAVVISALCVAGCASTQSGSTNVPAGPNSKQVDVASGKLTRIDMFSGVPGTSPKCTELPGTHATITKPPTQGVAKIVHTRDFSPFPPEVVASKCNKQRIPVWVVQYQSKPGYVGPDSFSFEKKFPDGDVIDATAILNVH
jgi:hypothetical protein